MAPRNALARAGDRPAPDPLSSLSLVGDLVKGDALAALGTEHERQVRVLTEHVSIVVTDEASCRQVSELLKEVDQRKRAVVEFFKPMKTLAHSLHKAICSRENAVLAPLTDIDGKARRAVVLYNHEQQRKQRDEEARIAEEARLAEQRRLEAEAALLETRGERRLAEAVLEQAIAVPAPTISLPSTTPKVAGIGIGEKWTWRPVGGDSPEARARAVQLLPREYLTIDDRKVNEYVRAHKSSGKLPGIEIYDAGSVTVRG